MTEGAFETRLERVLIRRIEGCSKLASVERLSGGAAQETYRLTVIVDGQERPLALRRAIDGQYQVPSADHPGLPVEAMLMRCAAEARVPAPAIYYVLTRADDLGDGIVMEWLDGETLGTHIVRSDSLAEVRPKLAYECGRILARIHSIDLDATGLTEKLGVITPREFVQQMWRRYQAYETPQPMIDYTARWLEDNLPENSRRTLVHNEFRNGNVMIAPEGVVAVLDWECAHIGDPMRDLGWMCTNSWRFNGAKPVGGFGEYEDFFRGYEAESGLPVNVEHVKFWEVFGSFWWSVTALGLTAQYRAGSDKSVERAAIGRRTSEAQVDCVNLLIPGPVDSAAAAPPMELDMPRPDELLASVSGFLRNAVMTETSGRTSFLARVSANAVDIVNRELALGPAHRAGQLERLQQIFSSDETLEVLTWRLVRGLRDGHLALTDEAVKSHLRTTVVNQIAIDRPQYNGYQRALAG